jgi:hypothetical protein
MLVPDEPRHSPWRRLISIKIARQETARPVDTLTGVPGDGTFGTVFIAMTGKIVIKLATSVCVVLLCSLTGLAQSTGPTTQPAADSGGPLKSLSGDQVLDQMLKPPSNAVQPLQPVPDKSATDKTSGTGAVKPDAPKVNVIREGTYVFDRVGRLTRTPSGQAELTFDSDGKALHDPPMIILPNQKLQQMEDQVTSASRDLKFHITGMVTEYRGRNYILLERAAILPDITQQF